MGRTQTLTPSRGLIAAVLGYPRTAALGLGLWLEGFMD